MGTYFGNRVGYVSTTPSLPFPPFTPSTSKTTPFPTSQPSSSKNRNVAPNIGPVKKRMLQAMGLHQWTLSTTQFPAMVSRPGKEPLAIKREPFYVTSVLSNKHVCRSQLPSEFKYLHNSFDPSMLKLYISNKYLKDRKPTI